MIKLRNLIKEEAPIVKEDLAATMQQVSSYFGKDLKFMKFIEPMFKDGETTMDDVVDWYKLWTKNKNYKQPKTSYTRKGGYWNGKPDRS